jgi:ketopantoate reductase
MAPEQLHEGRVDARSDLFSVGLLLVWLMTGWRRPNAYTLVPQLDKLIDDPDLRAALEEACAVAAADGAPIAAGEQWAVIESLPAGLTSSAARDVAAGRPSELDALVGAVVRAGRRLGVRTPTLDRLEAACRAL